MSTTRKYVRRSRQQWAELIELQPDSGLSISQFCKQAGVSYQSFQNWRKKLEPQALKADSASGFIELTAPSSSVADARTDKPGHWLIELDLGDGLRLRIARQ